MGVCGCGKTTVGAAIAEALRLPFIEGDSLHPAANVEKMSSGVALNDDDRWPWLDRIGAALRSSEEQDGAVAACSALRQVYRTRIAEAAGHPVRFVFLTGDRAILEDRMARRRHHYMPASLLQSQLETLEAPDEAEIHIAIDFDQSVEEMVEQALAWLTDREVKGGN